MITRRQLREHTFKILFSTDFYPSEEAEEQIDNYLEDQLPDKEGEDGEPVSREEDRQEVRTRAVEVLTRIPELDEELEKVTEGWKMQRIGKPELSILRLAAYEIRMDEAVDAPVAINEAVELARKYGDAAAPKFVNGVLAKLVP